MNKTALHLCLLIALLVPQTSSARPIVADLAVRSIDIDHDFTGIDILLFGARNDVGDIVVVVRGPEKPYIVRKKDRVFGIWTNTESITFNNAFQFYSIASTKPLEELKNNSLLHSLGIGIENLNPSTISTNETAIEFRNAFIQKKREQALYSNKIEKITFWGETLFRTVLKFPQNIPRGWYTVETYLFNDGQLSSMQSTPIHVSKIGFEAFMFDFAHRFSVLYGVLAIIIAIFAGFMASWIFRRV